MYVRYICIYGSVASETRFIPDRAFSQMLGYLDLEGEIDVAEVV